MDPRLSFVTLAVADLDAARRCYLDGLGWTPEHSDGEACTVHLRPGLMLTLRRRDAFEAEVGARTPTARAWGGYTGYFADPDGFRWEVAHNPGPTGEMVLP